MKIPRIVVLALGIFGLQTLANSSDDNYDSSELWVLVEIGTNFRTTKELDLVDIVTELIESKNLGELDGHSSGGNQFDFNYIEVTNFSEAKAVIEKKLNESYPQLKFRISKKYETSFESP